MFGVYKKLKFNNIVQVILIPNKEAYSDFKDQVWWNNYDYNNSLISFNEEIFSIIQKYPTINIRQAKNILYQPYNN